MVMASQSIHQKPSSRPPLRNTHNSLKFKLKYLGLVEALILVTTYPTVQASLTNVTSLVKFRLKLGIIKLLVEQEGLHLGEAREGICPPENRMAFLGYIVCIVTYIIP